MKAILQRVSSGGVKIESRNYEARISKGLVILLGVKKGDTENDLLFVADKCCNLRVFEDSEGKMNLSVKDVSGEILIISQFTLYGDTAKGNRPSFTDAALPTEAEMLYNKFIHRLQFNIGEDKIKTGIFGAMMDVEIINDGPVTLIVESKEKK